MAATWLLNRAGQAITEEVMVGIFTKAYDTAGSTRNARHGFEKAGIHPFDRPHFTDEDFQASAIRDRNYTCDNVNTDPTSFTESAPAETSAADPSIGPFVVNQPLVIQHISSANSSAVSTFTELITTPSGSRSTTARKRKVAHAVIIAVSPYKAEVKSSKKMQNWI